MEDMQEGLQDEQSIAARLRSLGSPTPYIDDSKLALALALAQDLLGVSSYFPSRADVPPLPVLAHYCRTVIEWTVSCIIKLKPPPPSEATGAGNASATASAVSKAKGRTQGAAQPTSGQDTTAVFLTRALRLWQLLQLLLEGNPRVGSGGSSGSGVRRAGSASALALAGAPAGGIPGSLLNAAAVCVRTAISQPAVAAAATAPATDGDATAANGEATDGPLPPLAMQLCRAVRCCLRVLLPAAAGGGGTSAPGGGGIVLRPSLEQCLTLLTALLDVRPRRGGQGDAAGTSDLKKYGSDVRTAFKTNLDAVGNVSSPKATIQLQDGCFSAVLAVEWAWLCATVLQMTHGSVQAHPTPKKVWKAFVPDLVLPLLDISQPRLALGPTLQLVLGPQAGLVAATAAVAEGLAESRAAAAAAAAVSELGRTAQQLLGAVLFQDAHVGALAELFFALLPYGEPEPDAKAAAAAAAAVAAAESAAAAVKGPLQATGDGGSGGGGRRPGERPPGTLPPPLLLGFWELVGRSYHGQLLQALATGVASSCGGGGSSSSSSNVADRIMLGLPWLLRGYCRAVARLRRNLASDAAAAAATAGDGGGGAASKGKRAANGIADGAASDDDGTAVTAPSHKALAAAEFNCLAVLSYILLQPPAPPADGAAVDATAGRPAKKRKLAAPVTAQQGAAPAAAAPYSVDGGPWRRLVLAGLLAAGRALGAYQPTRDLTGAHFAVLAVIAERLLVAAPELEQPATAVPHAATAATQVAAAKRKASRAAAATAAPVEGADGGTAAEPPRPGPYGGLSSLSTSLALCAVLDLDHRVLMAHLERVWSLLWDTAAAADASSSTTAEATAPAADFAAAPAAAAAAATAAAVLQRALRAFSELRQLQSLLESLTAAMRAVCGGGGGSVAQLAAPAAAGKVYGSCGGVVAALLVRPDVLAALRQAIRSAPSGQLPALVDWVAGDLRAWCEVVPQQTAAAAAADLFLAAGALYDTLLASLRLDLATAMPMARANGRLLTALSPPLLSSVRHYCKSLRVVQEAEPGGGKAGDDEVYGGGAAAQLQLSTARLAMLLRVYGAVVRTNAVCSGLHPEIQPLPEQDIIPQHKPQLQPPGSLLREGGYFAPALKHAFQSPDGGAPSTATAGGDGDGEASISNEIKRLCKALKRAGSNQHGAGLLPGLAQLALLPAVPCDVATAEGRGPSKTAAAPTWAALELSRAVQRCLGHRVQVLHERLLRRQHQCPLYGRAQPLGGLASAGRPASAAAAAAADDNGDGHARDGGANVGAGVGTLEVPERILVDYTEGHGEAEAEEAEVRLLASLALAPFSTKAAAQAGCFCGGGGGTRGGGGAAAAATAASITAAAWVDVLALMGSIGPWADRTALAEVLQLAVAAACDAPSLPPQRTSAGFVAGGHSPQHPPQLPKSSSTLRLLEFQGLPGVRQVLPYAWMAVASGALHQVAAAVWQLAGPAGPTADDVSAVHEDGSGRRLSKKAKKSGQDGSADAGALDVAAAAGKAGGGGRSRLTALLASAAAQALAGDNGGSAGSGKKTSSSRALQRLLDEQAEVLESVVTSSPDVEDAAETTPAATDAGGVAAGAATLSILLDILYDDIYLELIPRKACKALVRQVAAATAALLDMLCTLRPTATATAKAQKKHNKNRQAAAERPAVSLQSARREVLAVTVRCLRAWRRLSAAYGSDGGGELAALDGSSAAEDLSNDPRVAWLVRACHLLVSEAEALDDAAAATAAADASATAVTFSPPSRSLSLEVVYESGRLLLALLAAARGAGSTELSAAVATRLTLSHGLLAKAEIATTPAAKALMCSLSLAAAEAAVSAAAAAPQPPPPRRGAPGDDNSGGGGGCSITVAAEKALSRLARRSARLLSSPDLCGAADAAVAAAAAPQPVGAVAAWRSRLALRSALCLVACQGQLLQLAGKAAAAARAVAAAAPPACAAAKGGAQAGGKAAAGMTAAAAAAAAAAKLPLGADSLPELMIRASGWVAAERRLYDMAGTGCRGSSGDGGGAGAALATEPLEHCVALMYGIAVWLPLLARGGGADGNLAAGGLSAQPDELLALLVAVQQALLTSSAPPERFSFSRTSNLWGVLLADLQPGSAAYISRRCLLDCFWFALLRGNRGQLAVLLRGLVSSLRQEGRTETGQPPVQLVPALQCLLVSLERLTGPRVTKLLAAQGPVMTAALTELLAVTAARATAAGDRGGGGGGGGGGTTADAVWLYGSSTNRAAVEVVLCCSMRCLQSMLAREVTFRLPAPAVTGLLSAVLSVTSCPLLRPQPLLPTAWSGDAATAAVAVAPSAMAGTAAARPSAAAPGDGGSSGPDLYSLHSACCTLIAAVVRHHEGAVRHCAALVVAACRELLLRLAAWATELRLAQRQLQLRAPEPPAAATAAVATASDGLERCAAALARVYEAVSEHPKTLGKYAPHILADYVIHVATPLPSVALLMHTDDGNDPWVSDTWTTALVNGDGSGDGLYHGLPSSVGVSSISSRGMGATLLPQPAHEALRLGAYSLLACLGPPQLQHLHMALGAGDVVAEAAAVGGAGAARRAALALLRKQYDSSYKYTGKV